LVAPWTASPGAAISPAIAVPLLVEHACDREADPDEPPVTRAFGMGAILAH
jgi:hypothetical protein